MKPGRDVNSPEAAQVGSCTPDWMRRKWMDPLRARPAPDEVHVWRASSPVPPAELCRLKGLLSEDERRRAARFRFSGDSQRFIQARGMLRVLLGSYLEVDPSRIAFRFGEFGKPCLASPSADLHFNVAHSHELTLYAFSTAGEVGIDIEYGRANHDWREVGRCCFPPRIMAQIQRWPEEQARKIFYAEWTRMEARLKASGTGLTGLTPRTPGTDPAGDWNEKGYKVVRLDLGNDYEAALAMPSSGSRLAFFDVCFRTC